MLNIILRNYSSGTQGAHLLVKLPGELELPRLMRVDNVVWECKPEQHITLVGYGHKFSDLWATRRGCKKAVLEPVLGKTYWKAFQGVKVSWGGGIEFRSVHKDYQLPSPHRRHTIIVTCRLSGVEAFYKNLETLTDIRIPAPPFHITLYTKPDPESRQGIGIVTQKGLEECSQVLKLGQLPPVLYPFVL